MHPAVELALASTWQCGDRRLQVGQADGATRLVIEGRSYELRPVVAASGARFEAAGDPTTWFWNKGDQATVAVAGVTLPPCVRIAGDGRTTTARR